MKKFLALIMAVAMSSAVAYGQFQEVRQGEVYFSPGQFSNANADQIVTTFPLVYKGTLKMNGATGVYDGYVGYEGGCFVYKNKPSVQMYMTMCQGCINNSWCQNVATPTLSYADTLFVNVPGANFHPEDNNRIFQVGLGDRNAIMTSWNVYAVVTAKDIAKAVKNTDSYYAEDVFSDLINNKKDLVLVQDMLGLETRSLSLKGSYSCEYAFFTGTEKGDALLTWQDDLYNKKANSIMSGEKALLTGKKTKYNFRYTPALYMTDGVIAKDPIFSSGWFRTGASAETIGISCVKSFSGNIQVMYYEEVAYSPVEKLALLSCANGTMKLTLNSLTKTVANKIFGGDKQNASYILTNPTICEEGLALYNGIMPGASTKLNAFEYAVWGKKTEKVVFNNFSSGLLATVGVLYFNPDLVTR